VLFTDLVNYTAKVSRMDREGIRRILAEHENLVRPIIEARGGRIIKNIGDSFMCLLDSATDGLRAALEIQDQTFASGGHGIRVAMTTGDVEEIDGDVYGECVNLSARILSKAPGGEIWFGQGTRECMNDSEIPWEPVGRFRLKGIPGEQACYRCVHASQAILPDRVAAAAKSGNLVRVRDTSRPPILPLDPTVLFEGFPPGSRELEAVVSSLPVLNPSSLFLAAYQIPTVDRYAWEESGRGILIGTPQAIDAAIQETMRAVSRASGSDTIVLDVASTADVELVICGLALPAVPLSSVVASYSYELLPDGRWVNGSDRSILRVDVRPDGVFITALSPGVSVGGRTIAAGDSTPLRGEARIFTPTGSVLYVGTQGAYVGVMLADTEMRLGVLNGGKVEIGREPAHPGLMFPDRRGQGNIHWCTGSRAARARSGGFTLDRALAGRNQAEFRLNDDRIALSPLHKTCPTYVLRDGVLGQPLVASESPTDTPSVELTVGDMVVAGTTVVALRAPE